MRERLPKIRASQHGSDPLWKSEKRRRRSKTGGCCGSSEVAIVVPRCSWRRIFCGKRPFFGTKDGEHFRRAKVSWDGGDVAPVPRFPVSRGDRKKIQDTASVPKKSVSLKGCTSSHCAQSGARTGQLGGVHAHRGHGVGFAV